MFPIVTGRRFFIKKSATVTLAPRALPAGMRKMLAMLCSNPMVTNAAIGHHRAKTFPTRLEEEADWVTAMQTSL